MKRNVKIFVRILKNLLLRSGVTEAILVTSKMILV